jgi:ABC-type sugar transport system ATPase subunit
MNRGKVCLNSSSQKSSRIVRRNRRILLCDRINVVQHGQVTVDKSLSEIKLEELIAFMVQSFRREVATGTAK